MFSDTIESGCRCTSRRVCNGFGLVNGLDAAPLVRAVRQDPFCPSKGQAEQIGAAGLGVACTTAFRHFDESERLKFPDRGGDRCAIDAVFDKLVERDGQLAVVLTAM